MWLVFTIFADDDDYADGGSARGCHMTIWHEKPDFIGWKFE